MNSIFLNGQLIGDPQIRRTGGENDERVAEARIQFPGIGRDTLPSQLKVTAWNNAADQLINCPNGSTVQVSGRLSTFKVEHNGANERHMELVVNHVAQITIISEATEADESDAEVDISNDGEAEVALKPAVAAKSGKQATTARRGKRSA